MKILSEMASGIKKNGVGGPVEFIAASDVFGAMIDVVTSKANLNAGSIGDGWVMIGQFKVYQDNDSYIDAASDGKKTAKSLCDDGEIVARALNAGQSMPFCKLDDTVQRNAVAFYTFSVDRDDHRGTDIFSKSKPFPCINIKGITWVKFAAEEVSAGEGV